MARENPAAPNAKAAFPRLRMEPRFAFAMVEPLSQVFEEFAHSGIFRAPWR
jgi:hypothetical protein